MSHGDWPDGGCPECNGLEVDCARCGGTGYLPEPVLFFADAVDADGNVAPVTFTNVTLGGKPIDAVKVPASEIVLDEHSIRVNLADLDDPERRKGGVVMSERGVCICPECGCQFSNDRKAEMERIIARQGRAEDALRKSRVIRLDLEKRLRQSGRMLGPLRRKGSSDG